jgi:Ni/Fe-hydrogenase subunit HybB-like protein
MEEAMFDSIFRDLPMLLWFFFLRLVVPALGVLTAGWLLWHFFAPREAEEHHLSFSRFVLDTHQRLGPVRLPQLSARAIMTLLIVFLLWIAAFGFLLARYFYGLNTATGLTDYMPWGLWIAFKLACVASAAGGFTFAATVYVFRLDQYRPIARTAILTALLGYSTFIVSLIFDLGRWYNIWHPLIMWNPHSVMFEVAWCVMLYTAVLFFEFSPAALERFHLARAGRIVHNITLPLVVLGVVLSTLHQSSLGSLYLIMPEKLNPLWYSTLLPVFFFTSAVATGIAMMMVVPVINVRYFKANIPDKIMASLTRPAAIALAIYLALKVEDLLFKGMLPQLLTLNFWSVLLWLELLIGVIVPLAIFATPRARSDPRLRLRTASMVIAGTVLNRFNVALFGFGQYLRSVGASYTPSAGEWIITLALFTVALTAYVLAVKFLPVLPQEQRQPVFAK